MNPTGRRLAWCLAWLGLAGCLAASPAQQPSAERARPYLWKIHGPGKPSWILGTIHLRNPRVARLPQPVLDALATADIVCTEIPMDAATLRSITPRLHLPAGETLPGLLGAEGCLLLDGELQRHNPALNSASFPNLKPWAAAAALLQLEDETAHPGTVSMDQSIFQTARNSDREVRALETVEEQLSVFDTLSNPEQIAMLLDCIRQLDAIRAQGDTLSGLLTRLYLAGDLDTLVSTLLEMSQVGDHAELSRKLLDRLIHQRNVRLADRIQSLLRSHPEKSFFFAVGAAHLAGEDGILPTLEKAGIPTVRSE